MIASRDHYHIVIFHREGFVERAVVAVYALKCEALSGI
jgi:hypothetical protein